LLFFKYRGNALYEIMTTTDHGHRI